MKKFLLLLLFIFSYQCFANSLFREGTYAVVVIDKQSGSFYGDPLVRKIVNSGKFTGAMTIYIDPTSINTRSEQDQIIRTIARRVGKHKPLKVYIPSKYKSVKQKLSELYGEEVVQILKDSDKAERNSRAINSFLNSSKLEYENIFILHDSSTFSKEESSALQTKLIEKGIEKSKVQTVLIPSFQELRIWLNSKSKSEKSVILNQLYLLRDRELGSLKYSDDIKRELLLINKQHFDIGFHLARYNEALVITDNHTDIFEFTVLNKPVYIDTRVLLNQKRAKRLGFTQTFINAFHKIDGLIE